MINEPANMCWNKNIQASYEKERIEREKAEYENQTNGGINNIPGINLGNSGNSFMNNLFYTNDYGADNMPGIDINNIGNLKMSDLAFTGDYQTGNIPGIDTNNIGNIKMSDLAFTDEYQAGNISGIDINNMNNTLTSNFVITNDYEKYYKSDPVNSEQWQKDWDANTDVIRNYGEKFKQMYERWWSDKNNQQGNNYDDDLSDSAKMEKRKYEYYQNNQGDLDTAFPLLGLEDNITSGYGMRYHPISGQPDYHEGIDIGAKMNTPIYAVADGEVIDTRDISGYGMTTYIKHENGYESFYAHQSDFNVKIGDIVKKGQVIGYTGNSGGRGHTTGPHLHVGFKKYGLPCRPFF